MTSTVVYAEIVDGSLVLPPEAQAILPSGIPLYMVVDADRERVTIYASDVRAQLEKNRELLEALADLNSGLTNEEYTRPLFADSPDKFISDLIMDDPDRVVDVLRDMRLRLKAPPLSVEEFFAALRKRHLDQTAVLLARHSDRL